MDWSNLVGKGVLVQFRDPVLLAARSEAADGYGVSAHYLRTPDGEIPAMLPALAAKVVGHTDESVSIEYGNGAGDECVLHLAKAAIVAVTELRQRGKILTLRPH